MEASGVSTSHGYSAIVLVNGVLHTQQSGTANVEESGIIEVDYYHDSPTGTATRYGISILAGNLEPSDFYITASGNSISVYKNFANSYQKVKFTEISVSGTNATMTYVSELQSAAPTGGATAVIRNNATKALESNNNLLLNGTFQLNTQGLSVYPSNGGGLDECVDDWIIIDSTSRTGNVEVNEGGGITINATGSGFGIRQIVMPETTGAGKNYTMTVNVSNVGGNSETLTVYLRNTLYSASYGYRRINEAGIYSFPCTVPDDAEGNIQCYIAVEGTSQFSGECNYTIDWIKLEEGTVSTAPNGLVQNATQALYAEAAGKDEDGNVISTTYAPIATHNIKTYAAVSQLGLSYPCTTVEIMNALPLGSRIDVAVEAVSSSSTIEPNITDAPYTFGTLSIVRAAGGDYNRYTVIFVRGLSNDHSVWFGEYVADQNTQGITSVEYKQIINADGTSTPLMSGGVVPQQLTNEDLDIIQGDDYYGRTYWASGTNTCLNKPTGVVAFSLEVLRGAQVNVTIQICRSATASSQTGKPASYQRCYDASSWSEWEEIVTSTGTYSNLTAGYAQNIPTASETVIGGAKIYLDSDGYLNIDTRQQGEK